MDLCHEKRINPMIWSPLVGEEIFTGQSERAVRVRETVQKVSTELGVTSIGTFMYAWVLAHPANMMRIVGSGKLVRVITAALSTKFILDRKRRFTIF